MSDVPLWTERWSDDGVRDQWEMLGPRDIYAHLRGLEAYAPWVYGHHREWALILAGATQRDIAAAIGISQPSVCVRLRTLARRLALAVLGARVVPDTDAWEDQVSEILSDCEDDLRHRIRRWPGVGHGKAERYCRYWLAGAPAHAAGRWSSVLTPHAAAAPAGHNYRARQLSQVLRAGAGDHPLVQWRVSHRQMAQPMAIEGEGYRGTVVPYQEDLRERLLRMHLTHRLDRTHWLTR